jgi:hypothetical protein
VHINEHAPKPDSRNAASAKDAVCSGSAFWLEPEFGGGAMNDPGLMAAQWVETYRGIFEVFAVALVALVVLVVLAQAAVMALCCWETMRSLARLSSARTASKENRPKDFL